MVLRQFFNKKRQKFVFFTKKIPKQMKLFWCPQTNEDSWINFYSKLNWYYQTVTAIEKATKANQA
jgi:hypothetical protein